MSKRKAFTVDKELLEAAEKAAKVFDQEEREYKEALINNLIKYD